MISKGSKNPEIDLGLAISGATLEPGKTRSLLEISFYCGCTKQNIDLIEKRALRKIRNKVLFNTKLREELALALGSQNGPVQCRDHKRRTEPPII